MDAIEFERMCDLLPLDVNWGDKLTPEIAQAMEAAALRLSRPAPTPVAVPDVLTCDDCGAATTDPWHSSKGARRHYHRCDACHAEALAVPAVPVAGVDDDIKQLMKFYAVTDLESLAKIQSQHIERLQKKLPPMRDEQPRNPRAGGE